MTTEEALLKARNRRTAWLLALIPLAVFIGVIVRRGWLE